MRRTLHFFLAFLLLASTPVGANVQTAVFSACDDVKVVTVHSVVQEFTPVISEEAEPGERIVVRSQKKSTGFQKGCCNDSLFESSKISFNLPSIVSRSQESMRVFLLPKSLQTVIFLQTLV